MFAFYILSILLMTNAAKNTRGMNSFMGRAINGRAASAEIFWPLPAFLPRVLPPKLSFGGKTRGKKCYIFLKGGAKSNLLGWVWK